MIRFTDKDRQKITTAIHGAERNTSGEFVAVVAHASDHYTAVALFWAAGLALLVPGVLLLSPLHLKFIHIYELQLLIFVGLVLLFEFVPSLHLALVPKAVKHQRASWLAHAQFYEQGVHLTRHHSGVLFFVSLAERYVEVVADKGIHEKLGDEHWRLVVDKFLSHVRRDEITEGFVAAITACGAAMAEHYPAGPDDSDELSDGLIEI
ncbi:MAG TPA: TPM domain-containing protein [Gammaproteobacteria bacterium]|nr:TPM domain-containing protein [Gammaproteobacteria bacterium]